MRFLVDANLSPVVASHLRAVGCEATHVADHGILRATRARAVAWYSMACLTVWLGSGRRGA
ncbi:MAG: DUF5615 family PIN-like protein [Bifidobacteriaceae bacterium]|jgi:predicted nuclease of predicted toxin-antitoxin system|nr:DUF5615 family PIN-like protein [Bifidobacteriaceae bacterium]